MSFEAVRAQAFQTLVEGLAGQGWATVRPFLPSALLHDLRQDLRARFRAGRFVRAGVGANAAHRVAPEVRGDLICWWDPAEAAAAQRRYLEVLEALRSEINRALFLGLWDLEIHYSVYPRGAFYARHRDQLRGSDARRVTTLLYLNRRWEPGDGGALRLYLPSGPMDLWPEENRFVCFLSEDLEHEVRRARRERLSVAGWLRRRPLAAP